MILVGLAVIFGLDKMLQAWILDPGAGHAPIEHLEEELIG